MLALKLFLVRACFTMSQRPIPQVLRVIFRCRAVNREKRNFRGSRTEERTTIMFEAGSYVRSFQQTSRPTVFCHCCERQLTVRLVYKTRKVRSWNWEESVQTWFSNSFTEGQLDLERMNIETFYLWSCLSLICQTWMPYSKPYCSGICVCRENQLKVWDLAGKMFKFHHNTLWKSLKNIGWMHILHD